MSELLYGKNPILEALRAGRREVHRFYYTQGEKGAALEEAVALAGKSGVQVLPKDRSWFEREFPNALSQGWAAEVGPYPYLELGELIQTLPSEANLTLLALDQVQDPQNLGAILRSAEACGVHGVLIPERRSAPISPVVAKASAGAVEYLQICRVSNLVKSFNYLKDIGFWCVGTSTKPGENILNFTWPEKTVLVLGSEGRGMRRLVTEKCDFLIHVPIIGRIQSLNVSATAAVCLYQRLGTQKKNPSLNK